MGLDVSLEQALEYCLQELTETGDIEASLRRFPQYVDQLRPQLELAQAMRVFYSQVPEAPGGLKVGRERMLAAAAEQRQRGVAPASAVRATPAARRWRLAPLRFFALALAVALAVVVTGGGLVWASTQSLPGDLLYPVKLVTEDVRMALASTPAERVELALSFADERIDESQALVVADRPISDGLVAQIQGNIEQALTQAASAGDAETPPLLTEISRRTRAQIRALEQMRETAPDRDQPQLERAMVTCRRGAEAAEEGLQDPQRFRQRRQHRLTDDEPPIPEPEQGGQPPEPENQREDETQLVTATPSPAREVPATATPKRPQATTTPRATHQRPQPTATATRQEELQGPEPSQTPRQPTITATPREPMGPKATATPQASRPTNTPETLPSGPEATATPKGSQTMPTPHATSQSPGAPDPPQGTSQGSEPDPSQSSSTTQPEPPGNGSGGK
jgi:hypothetical protein